MEQGPNPNPIPPQQILIIDDDPLLAGMLQRILGLHECAAVVAVGGREGIAMAQSLQPSAIICDESMPDVTGHEVVATLKNSPATAHIPILLMSGLGDVALRNAADGFISKPFNAESVLAALKSLARRSATDASEGTDGTDTGRQTGPSPGRT